MVVLEVRGYKMALLTKEQIEEVVHIFLNNRDTNAVVIKTAMENWNEKQPAQFKPDWSKAPEGTDSVIIKSYWVNDGIWTFGENVVKYDRPAPVITPHPHAAIMAKYAEVAARRSDPWVEFEHCCDDIDEDYWIQCDAFIGFHSDYFYRHISYRHIGDKK